MKRLLLLIIPILLVILVSACSSHKKHHNTDMPDAKSFNAHFGDMDANGDDLVNAADFAVFAECYEGPNGTPPEICGVFDFNGDAVIDLQDYAAFQEAAGS